MAKDAEQKARGYAAVLEKAHQGIDEMRAKVADVSTAMEQMAS